MAAQVILGTAGHIDHGKTSLIRTLTGIDTDRLKEEKARGITIELGFAHLSMPNGTRVGIVDVPGHEKFVRHMVAGATGIDLVALVVAADEGVMPQTREHVEICQLLGVRAGLIVITKIDLVDEEWLEMVEEDIRDFAAGTFLEGAPLVRFSALDGRGGDQVIEAVTQVTARLEERQTSSLFRMPLDRVFTMKGFGTVVTGTAISGILSLGDTVMIYPIGLTAKVRGLQVHNESVTQAQAGARTAVNLQGVEKERIQRGQVLAPPDTLHPGRRMDLWIHHLASADKPLKNRTQVRFHIGTTEILGRIILLDRGELAPGDSAPAQILLEEPGVCLAGDRFVLRSYSPIRTIAGGEVLNPNPLRHKRFQEQILADLETLRDHDPVRSLKILIESAGPKGTSAQDLAGLIDLPAKQIKNAVDRILSRQEAIAYDKEQGRLIGRKTFDRLVEKTLSLLAEYHQKFPVRPGLGREELKTRVSGLEDYKLLAFLLDHLVKTGRVVSDRDLVHLAEHRPQLADELQQIEERLINTYREAGPTPPYFKEAAVGLPGSQEHHREILEHLVKQGRLVKVKTDLYFDSQALAGLWDQARAFLRKTGELTTPQFKEITGLSRKYLIPILEHFDARGLTIRVGEVRVLRSDKG